MELVERMKKANLVVLPTIIFDFHSVEMIHWRYEVNKIKLFLNACVVPTYLLLRKESSRQEV